MCKLMGSNCTSNSSCRGCAKMRHFDCGGAFERFGHVDCAKGWRKTEFERKRLDSVNHSAVESSLTVAAHTDLTRFCSCQRYCYCVRSSYGPPLNSVRRIDQCPPMERHQA